MLQDKYWRGYYPWLKGHLLDKRLELECQDQQRNAFKLLGLLGVWQIQRDGLSRQVKSIEKELTQIECDALVG
jgi:hypothetical protein